jgi:AcrR family transcriptional regulator
MSNEQKRPRRWLRRCDWLAAAVETLLKEGIESVRIERLARDLQVTKGSFYGHFRDRPELLGAVLEYWEQQTTGAVRARINQLNGSASERLLWLMQEVDAARRGRFDVAVRAWAVQDTVAKRAVRRQDVARHEIVRELFNELGFESTAADDRTRMVNYFLLGQQSTSGRMPRQDRRALIEFVHQLVIQPSYAGT